MARRAASRASASRRSKRRRWTIGLVELLAGAPDRLAPHVHAPLQSGSDRLLQRMGRHWYTRASYAASIERSGEPHADPRTRRATSSPDSPVRPTTITRRRCARSTSCRSRTCTCFRIRRGRARRRTGFRDRVHPAAIARTGGASCATSRRRKAATYAAARAGGVADVVVIGGGGRTRRGHRRLSRRALADPAFARGDRFVARLVADGDSLCAVAAPEPRGARGDCSETSSGMTDPRPTVYVETYGCQMNVSDSELMLGKLAAHGYDAVDRPDGADVILVNTCAIRDHAEQRVIGRLGELKRNMKPGVDRRRDRAAWRSGSVRSCSTKAKHVSVVIGPDGYRALPALIDGARARRAHDRDDVRPRGALRGLSAAPLRQGEGVDPRAARLRLSLHVLHRADDARRGAQPSARRRGARGGSASSPRA